MSLSGLSAVTTLSKYFSLQAFVGSCWPVISTLDRSDQVFINKTKLKYEIMREDHQSN